MPLYPTTEAKLEIKMSKTATIEDFDISPSAHLYMEKGVPWQIGKKMTMVNVWSNILTLAKIMIS